MFKITAGKGFHITFENGWTASVQFGPGNYCSHHDEWDFNKPKENRMWESYDAEIAAWSRSGEMISLGRGDTVDGWITANQVLVFLNWVAGEDHSNPPVFK